MQGAQLSVIRSMNDKLICDLLRRHGPLSRVDLAKLSTMSVPALLKIVDRLIRLGVVEEIGSAPPVRPGPRARLFALTEATYLITSLSLVGERMKLTHSTLAGTIVAAHDVELHEHTASEEILRLVRPPDPRLSQLISVGLPGPVNPETGELLTDDLLRWPPGMGRRLLEETHASTVVFHHAVHLQAIAEREHGVAQASDDFLWLDLDTQASAALVLDGSLRRGAHGTAGEAGGSVPRLPGAAILAEVAGAEHDEDYAWLAGLSRRPHSNTWDALAAALGPGLESMTAFIDPAMIVLGGTIPHRAGTPLIEAVYRWFANNYTLNVPEVRLSTLGDDAVVLGAAMMGWESIITRLLD